MKKVLAIVLAIAMLLPALALDAFAVEDLTEADSTKCVLIQTGNVFGNLYCGDMVDVSKPGNYTVKVTGLNVGNTSDTGFFIGLKSGATSTNGSTASTLPEGTKITVTSAKINSNTIGLNGTPSLTVTDSTVDMVLKLAMWNTDVFTGTFPSIVNSIELGINVEMPASNRPAPAETASAEIPVEISAANQGSTRDCTISGGVATSTEGANQFSFKLPTTYAKDDVIKVRIRYSSDDQFRVRLSTNNANTSGTDWVFVDASASEKEVDLEFTALVDDISEIYFKARSYDSSLSNLRVSYIAIVTEAEEQVIVCFDDPSGDDVGIVDPWNFFGVGDYWGVHNDLDITVEEVKDLFRLGNVEFRYIFSGEKSQAPKISFNFNKYSGNDVNAPCFVQELTAGLYQATVKLETLLTAWDAIGKNIDDPDVVGFFVQPWASNFKLYHAEFVIGGNTPISDGLVPPNDLVKPSTGYMSTAEIAMYPPEFLGDRTSGVNYNNVNKITYYSTVCGMDRKANVLLPYGYDPAKKYPALYVLHGIFGDEDSMVGYNVALQNMMADGTAEKMIVVFVDMFATVDPNLEAGFNEEAVRAYDNFINDLETDLMPYIQSHYSVKTGRANTAIFGFSMGGRESLAIGLMRPELFGYVAAACPAPGVVPAQDWAMTHKGQLPDPSYMKFDGVSPYVLMLARGDEDTTVNPHPENYHNYFTQNNTDHIWYTVEGSGHGDPAVMSVLYNYAKLLFRAGTQGPETLFYSPNTGNDSTGNGTKSNPYKTEEKVVALMDGYSNADDITVLEYMMTVNVYTDNGFSSGSASLIPFTGRANSHYFTGEVIGTGFDTQRWGVPGAHHFFASYVLRGTDYTGKECTIFIDNVGDDLDKCTPYIRTDSAALAELNTAELRSIVDVVGGGVNVNVYKIHHGAPTSAPAETANTDSLSYTINGDTLVVSGTGAMANYTIDDNLSNDAIKKVVVEEGVTSIGNYAFYGCTALESVELPASVKTIGDYAFRHCDKLADIDLGNVESVGYAAMSYTAITKVPKGLKNIEDFAFARCNSITNAAIPGADLGLGAFYGCDGLVTATVANGCKDIGNFAFFDCPALKEVDLPECVKTIGGFAFANCELLETADIPYNTEVIGRWAFYNCPSITELYVPDSVTEIAEFAFKDCTALTTAAIPASVTNMGDGVFHNCNNLKIHGYAGTYAQSYASSYSIPFVTHDELGRVEGHTLSLAGEIGVNHYFSLSDSVVADEDAYVLFTLPDGTKQKVNTYGISKSSNGYYKISCSVVSTQMTGTIYAQIFSNGMSSDVFSYSVQEYGSTIVNYSGSNAAYNKVKPLVKAMLTYGGYAQNYFGVDYMTDNSTLASSILSESDKSLAGVTNVSGYEETLGNLPSGIKYYASTLILQSMTDLRHYFVVSSGHSIDEYTFTVNGNVITPVAKGGRYYVSIANISAPDLDTAYVLKINGNDALTYSAMTYVQKQLQNPNASEELTNMMKALYLYNQAANEYYGF